MTSLRNLLAVSIVGFALSGCAVGPRPRSAQVAIPSAYTATSTVDQSTASEDRWWLSFHDPELTRLEERAALANYDLQAAMARVLQARASAGVSRAALLPEESFNFAGQRARQRFFTGINPNGSPNLRAIEYNNLQATFDTSWEIDLWGRVRRNYQAARYDLQAQRQDRRNVLVSVLSDVATNYAQLRRDQARLEIARQNVTLQKDTLRLTEAQAAAGLATGRDVEQAKAQLANTIATIPTLQYGVEQSVRRLGVLLGSAPDTLAEELRPAADLMNAPQTVPTGLPSDLLQRRPDIQRADAQVHAAVARYGAAKAEYLPKITMTAQGGRNANQFSEFGLGAGNIFTLGPTVSFPLFNFGRIAEDVRLQDAKTSEAIATYRKTVMTAIEETEDALTALDQDKKRSSELERAVAANSTAVDLSRTQFAAGLADFLVVLSAERDLYNAQDALLQTRAAILSDMISLYKALGGGWSLSPEQNAVPNLKELNRNICESERLLSSRWARPWSCSAHWPLANLRPTHRQSRFAN